MLVSTQCLYPGLKQMWLLVPLKLSLMLTAKVCFSIQNTSKWNREIYKNSENLSEPVYGSVDALHKIIVNPINTNHIAHWLTQFSPGLSMEYI